jgi:four helix bundle protein
MANLARSLGQDPPTKNAAVQLSRAAASVGANYRAAGLSRTRKEFISRLGLLIEEADECTFWLEYVQALSHPRDVAELAALMDESRQLARIFTAARTTARHNAG